MDTIRPEELAQLRRQQRVHIVDVRTPEEFDKAHIEGSVNIPLDELTPERLPNDGQPVYLVCRRGTRAEVAWQRLHEEGKPATVISGGLFAWYDADLPVAPQPRKPPFFTRQRMIVSSLSATSILLAICVHRGLLGLLGYVAAYVVYVNIADYRKLRIFLAREAPDDSDDRL